MSVFRFAAGITLWGGCFLQMVVAAPAHAFAPPVTLATSRALVVALAPAAASTLDYTIAVADFSGQDREMGRFLADTLLTDLAQSDRLRFTERSEIRHALTEMKLQSTGLAEPQKVKSVGKLIGADRLIVGGYLVRKETIFVNARMLDVRTGRLVQGTAATASGGMNDEMAVVHRLARLVHRRLTGAELVLGDERPGDSGGSDAPRPSAASEGGLRLAPADPPPSDPAGARHRPNDRVTERDLDRVARRLSAPSCMLVDLPFQMQRPAAPVARIRALAALVKARCTRDELDEARDLHLTAVPADMRRAPRWARPYAALAVDRDWWPADRMLRPSEVATWAFVDLIVERMGDDSPDVAPAVAPPAIVSRGASEGFSRGNDGSSSSVPAAAPTLASAPAPRADPVACTGLIIQADGLEIERAMSVRILDDAGNVLYPDPKHLPNDDFLQDQGMVAYIHRGDTADRAGPRPLVIRAVATASAGRQDLVVESAAARRILDENRRGRFIATWKVCVLVDDGR